MLPYFTAHVSSLLRPGLNFIARDFSLSIINNLSGNSALPLVESIAAGVGGGNSSDSSLSGILNDLSNTTSSGSSGSSLLNSALGGGRKLHQAANGTNSSRNGINDPYYVNGTQYYVDKVNATGAWNYTQGVGLLAMQLCHQCVTRFVNLLQDLPTSSWPSSIPVQIYCTPTSWGTFGSTRGRSRVMESTTMGTVGCCSHFSMA